MSEDNGHLSDRLIRLIRQEPCSLHAGSSFETPLNVPALNSNESPKLILRAAGGMKAGCLGGRKLTSEMLNYCGSKCLLPLSAACSVRSSSVSERDL